RQCVTHPHVRRELRWVRELRPSLQLLALADICFPQNDPILVRRPTLLQRGSLLAMEQCTGEVRLACEQCRHGHVRVWLVHHANAVDLWPPEDEPIKGSRLEESARLSSVELPGPRPDVIDCPARQRDE